jgi:hypothetical protein
MIQDANDSFKQGDTLNIKLVGRDKDTISLIGSLRGVSTSWRG